MNKNELIVHADESLTLYDRRITISRMKNGKYLLRVAALDTVKGKFVNRWNAAKHSIQVVLTPHDMQGLFSIVWDLKQEELEEDE